MKDIRDLEKDIYKVLDSGIDHDPSPDLAAEYAMRIGGEMAKATRPRSQEREYGKLWASDLGETCLRKQYYKFNSTDEKEPLLGHTKFKFLYGNILEEAVLYLAEEAGHDVRNQQGRVEASFDNDWVVSGRIDAVVDGVLVDVKSTSSFGYKKYESEGLLPSNDTFGYLWQLGFYYHYGYVAGGRDSGRAGFIWIDKQNGHILYNGVYPYLPTSQQIDTKVRHLSSAVITLDPFKVATVPDGKSGNMKLSTKCSYCDFKHKCWEDANGGKGLRTFLYSSGPVYFTNVKREPKVEEIT